MPDPGSSPMAQTGPSFGTSGLRGLVVDLTPALVANYVRAFVQTCPTGGGVHLGWDLRPSSPDIAAIVADTLVEAGLQVTRHAALPTPALAMAAMAQGQAAIMITGSHIPADRNGLKFYVPQGEITKAQEAAIGAALGTSPAPAPQPGTLRDDDTARTAFVARYVAAYGPRALEGLRVGVYQQSSVARDLLPDVLAALGAVPVALGFSDSFIPVDTEAVDLDTRAQLVAWCTAHGLDALVSTDGDADRPLVADATGRVVPGDVLGAITADALGAEAICTPVSANTLIEAMTRAPNPVRVTRTRIGSPFVIAAMEEIRQRDPNARVVGYEPNGGFLLGFTASGPEAALAPLMTRDFLLPIVASLAAARAQGVSLAGLWAGLPARFTAADRVQNVPTAATRALIEQMVADPAARAAFFAGLHPQDGHGLGAEQAIDLTDGLRVLFAGDEVVHLRPSGNAPECRCYAEAASPERAGVLVAAAMASLEARLGG